MKRNYQILSAIAGGLAIVVVTSGITIGAMRHKYNLSDETTTTTSESATEPTTEEPTTEPSTEPSTERETVVVYVPVPVPATETETETETETTRTPPPIYDVPTKEPVPPPSLWFDGII